MPCSVTSSSPRSTFMCIRTERVATQMAEQNNNRRDGKDPQKALPPETIPRKVPENYVDEAERIMRALISSGTTVTTSKIRNLLSLVTDIYNDESIRTEDKLKPDSVVKLNLMRVRVAYEYGRDNGESVGKDKVYPMKEFITQAHLREYLKGISTDRADLIRFAHYMEALVAFHRYLGGKEN
ncbi:MAG TPA: type III-A CRISPR-associated protein Csm2 [Faecalibacterium sp.]|nr:type III-A CRISPR-associated protein Csm2 [Faecalibacterium sp.]